MNIGVLATVARAAMDDPQLKARLVQHPDEVADSLQLSRREVRKLADGGQEAMEVMIGSQIIYRLLPFPAGEKLLIVPQAFDQAIETQRLIIRIDQTREGGWIGPNGLSQIEGRTFGGGGHPTTLLCLDELETHLQQGDHVLDLGTGSGVIAIAAAMLGAESVDACDVDAFAAETAQRNVEANGLGAQVSVTQEEMASLMSRVGQGAYDLLMTNILGPVHVENLQAGLADLLRPGGTIVLSGFKESFVPGLCEALDMQRVDVDEVVSLGHWSAIAGHHR